MTTERHIAVMSLMNDIEAPTKTYRSALRKAWRTATDSAENNAAKDKGNTALEEIEGIVRDWVANHPQTDADRLQAAARRALTAFEDLIADSRDPGVEALGARYELAHALQRISPYERPLDEPGFDPRADRLDAITRAIARMIPGADPKNLNVTITEPIPGGGSHNWTGSVEGLAEDIHLGLAAVTA